MTSPGRPTAGRREHRQRFWEGIVQGLSSEACESLMDNTAAYLASWLRVLRKDSRMMVFAAAAAQKAVDHIRDVKTPERTESTVDLELAA
jgi:antirestriction protein ArdC